MGTLLKKAIIIVLLLCTGALAQMPAHFFDGLQGHPSLRAARANLDAAEYRLQGVYGPIAIAGTFGYVRSHVSDEDLQIVIPPELFPDLDIPPIELFSLPERSAQLSLEATFRPFVYGDIADLAHQRELDLRRAQLTYLEALTSLQAQALETAFSVQLAERAVQLAREALRLAEDALEVTRLRAERGVTTPLELREAEAAVQEAQAQMYAAEAERELAQRSLVLLVGEVAAPDVADLPPVRGISLEVQRAQLDLELARVGVQNAERALYPVAQAGYTWNLNDDHSTVGVSVESRTLQPRLAYTYQNPGRSFPQDQIRGNFQLGVSVNLSPDALASADAARAQQDAAHAALEAALERAELQSHARRNAFEQANRQQELARLALQNAEVRLADTTRRLELGLATPLERQQVLMARNRAEVNVMSARLERLRRQLDDYRAFGVPLSEILR